MKTLLVIDVQNDFAPGGALAVPEGDAIIPVINQLMPSFELVIATQDWHPKDHASFASSHENKQPFEIIALNDKPQTLWPEHCIQDSIGAAFCPSLNDTCFDVVFRKGTDLEVDSYSGFYDNHRLKSTGLTDYLKDKGVTHIYFSGLCADICVYFTILDAVSEGFECTLIEDATKPLDDTRYQEIKKELEGRVRFVSSEEALAR